MTQQPTPADGIINAIHRMTGDLVDAAVVIAILVLAYIILSNYLAERGRAHRW